MHLKLKQYVTKKTQATMNKINAFTVGKNTRNGELTYFYLSPCSLRCSCVSCSSACCLCTGPLKTFSTFLFAILTVFIAIAPHVIIVLKLAKGLVQKLNEFLFLQQSSRAFVFSALYALP